MTENAPAGSKLAEVTCRHCHATFGYTDGLHFYTSLGKAFRFNRSLTAECMTCRKPVYWNAKPKTKRELIGALETRCA